MAPPAILLILTQELIYSTTSQFTQSPLCLSGAPNDAYDGTYNYFATNLDPRSGVWYDDSNQQYLFAWNYGNDTVPNVEWRVGPSYSNSSAHLACPTSNTYNGYYAILDQGCSNWYAHFADSGWTTASIYISSGTCSPTPSPTLAPTSSPTSYSASDDASSFTSSIMIIIGVVAVVFCALVICLVICSQQKKKNNSVNKVNPTPTPTTNTIQSSTPGQYAATTPQQPNNVGVISNATPQIPVIQPKVVYVTPQPQPVIMGQQPKVVYVQAAQPAGQAPIYAQPPPASMEMQPGGLGLNTQPMQPPPPAYKDPNILTTAPVHNQAGESDYITAGMQEAPPVYQDINPSAPPAYQM